MSHLLTPVYPRRVVGGDTLNINVNLGTVLTRWLLHLVRPSSIVPTTSTPSRSKPYVEKGLAWSGCHKNASFPQCTCSTRYWNTPRKSCTVLGLGDALFLDGLHRMRDLSMVTSSGKTEIYLDNQRLLTEGFNFHGGDKLMINMGLLGLFYDGNLLSHLKWEARFRVGTELAIIYYSKLHSNQTHRKCRKWPTLILGATQIESWLWCERRRWVKIFSSLWSDMASNSLSFVWYDSWFTKDLGDLAGVSPICTEGDFRPSVHFKLAVNESLTVHAFLGNKKATLTAGG